MGAQAAIALVIGSLAEEVQIEIREQHGETEGVFELGSLARRRLQAQPVRPGRAFEQGDEEACGMRVLHGRGLAVQDHRDFGGLGQERAHFPARRFPPAYGMRTQDAESIAVVAAHNRFDF